MPASPTPGESEAHVVHGSTPLLIRRTRRVRVGVVVLAVLCSALIMLTVVFAEADSRTPLLGAPTQESLGLQKSMELSFPDCAVVTVDWHDLTGGEVGFAAQSATEAIYASDCHGTTATPSPQCPPAVCPPGSISMGPGPLEYQTASHGSFQFTATQPHYAFYADVPNSRNLSNDSVQVNLSYAVPLVPYSAALPSLVGLLVVGPSALAVGVWTLLAQRKRRG
jgi:hypothetical protein